MEAVFTANRLTDTDKQTVQENTDKQTQYKSEKVNNLKYSKTKLPWFSCLLQHSVRKRGGLILQRPRAHAGPELWPICLCVGWTLDTLIIITTCRIKLPFTVRYHFSCKFSVIHRNNYRVAQNKPDYLFLLFKFCISTTKHVRMIMYV